MNCNCPQCGSHNTKAFSVLYRDGERISRYTRNGWHTFRGGFGVHSSVATGRTRTLTSQMAAPPVPLVSHLLRSGMVPFVLIIAAVVWGSTGFFVALVVLVILALLGAVIDAENHERNLAHWQNSFRCGRCGTVFEVEDREI